MMLPVVWSAELLKVMFHHSLFARMVDRFAQQSANSPVYSLNKQNRMHPQISIYINKEVYGYRTLDSDTLLGRDFLLKRKLNYKFDNIFE